MLMKAVIDLVAGWRGYAMLALVAFALGGVAGTRVTNWHRDSLELAEAKAVDKAISAYKGREASIAAEAEKRIADLRTTERVTNKVLTREIVNHATVYSTDCITDAGRLRFNEAFASGAGASQPAAKVPGKDRTNPR